MANGGPGVDIATLGIRVDATDLERGQQAMRRFADEGTRTEQRMSSYTRAMRERSQTEREVIGLLHQEALAMDRARGGTSRITQETERLGRTTRRSMDGIGRMNNSLVVLARQAAGAHPVVGQLTDVVGSFAIGTAMMVPVLAGLAAFATGWRLITKDAREARTELDKNLNLLREFAREQDIARRGGAQQIALAAGQSEAARLAAGLRAALGPSRAGLNIASGTVPDQDALAARLLEQLREQNRLNAEMRRFLQGEAAEKRLDELQERVGGQLANLRVLGIPGLEAAADAQVAAFQRQQGIGARNQLTADMRANLPGIPSGISDERAILHAIGFRPAEQVEAAIKRAEQQGREAAAARAKLEAEEDRLTDALIDSARNVAIVFGGTFGQVLSLGSSVLAIHQAGRLSGFGEGQTATFGQNARGFGAAALTGVGFGASTGDPFLGGLGGGIAGHAMLGGPAGIIVGAVGGIVSGLIEHGNRAREAQRVWRLAFEDFQLMFDDLTPTEQRLRQNDRAFAEAVKVAADARGVSTGITSATEARLMIEAIRGSAAINFDKWRQWALDLEKLVAAHADNAEQATKLAEAERELFDARFQTLNAPTGFNAAYFGYVAGSGFVPPTGGGGGSGGGDVVVNGDVNIINEGEFDAQKIRDEIKRFSRRGGPAMPEGVYR